MNNQLLNGAMLNEDMSYSVNVLSPKSETALSVPAPDIFKQWTTEIAVSAGAVHSAPQEPIIKATHTIAIMAVKGDAHTTPLSSTINTTSTVDLEPLPMTAATNAKETDLHAVIGVPALVAFQVDDFIRLEWTYE